MLENYSHRTQLVFSAIAASAATAGLIGAYQTYTRVRRREKLNEDAAQSIQNSEKNLQRRAAKKPDETDNDPKARTRSLSFRNWIAEDGAYSEELILEHLKRNYSLFGEGMMRVRGATVAIVGCGGVGSWAAVMLVRSGVSRIRLIDFDYVTLSSLNRHATATLADVGTPKVACIARTLKAIARWVDVDTRVEVWRKEDGKALLDGADWVVDAIDNITTKVDLIQYCVDNKIKVFSSMGAGAKFDPTRVQIADISNTVYDPLARSVRQRLRARGVTSGVPAVYSTEVPQAALLPLDDEEFQQGNVNELAVFPDFRVRIMPVLGPLPAIFGLHIATYILCELAGKPIEMPLPVKNRKKLYEKMLRNLHSLEERHAREVEKLPEPISIRLSLDEGDVSFILEDIHHGRSLIPPHAIPVTPSLSRWDPQHPLSLENCVVFDAGELARHVAGCRDGKSPEQIWGSEVDAIVQRRRAEIGAWRQMVG
ncbi:hypothetical protein BD410DRAFT_760842 [Rickenella mellea]|uniref:THIF-type NAD/FAD binding fold domain-containing protein n=1 Tax=Rickenella mellea TaxID=50990 RepID=A0A4Y7QJ88_9AGAM|nr:hypothetical protein BD410DRAFT_760842 [Rickenella mellea]